VWILKCASRSAKEENDFGQLEHLKLEGLKIKTILVFCRDQSVFRGSYYGTKHSSKGTEPNSNGTEHHSNDRTLTTAAANTTAAAKATAAAREIASELHRYGSVYAKHSKYVIMFCANRELTFRVGCVLKKVCGENHTFDTEKVCKGCNL
jgi:predicted regulator of Ras-like GTPase activity (Roadblock/LC7/MglB family)